MLQVTASLLSPGFVYGIMFYCTYIVGIRSLAVKFVLRNVMTCTSYAQQPKPRVINKM